MSAAFSIGAPSNTMTLVPSAQLRVDPRRGALYMLVAMFLLAALDATAKWLTADYPVTQIALSFFIGGLLLSAGLAPFNGGIKGLRTTQIGWHLLRAVFNLGTMLTYYYALRSMNLADAMAITFAAPCFMTILSVPLLGEKVGRRRWLATVVGLIGVVIIVRPSIDGVDTPALLAVAAAVLYALMQITSRRLSATEGSHTILFYYSIFGLIAVSTQVSAWPELRVEDLGTFCLIGIFGSAGLMCLSQACRYGEVSFLAPLEYSQLFWGVLFGILLWGEVPDFAVIVGIAIIVISGLYLLKSPEHDQAGRA
jgi:drug/metabolite transporter (DMT)-like permease